MTWTELALVFYLGGAVAQSLGWLADWQLDRTEEDRRKHREIGSVSRSFVLSGLLWPGKALFTVTFYAAKWWMKR